MSNSRLEKFIYAICGMEVDDLPTPLSRIETLWNCLITGETPDFEPLSRNEKYLMSMIGQYDILNLPEPASRSEKLLYKIATGETDLTDVPGYLSRYEELLKQLIENGGIGGTDFEYVLYTLNDSFSTLYSTAEAPVKSAILSGQTLVNLLETEKEKYTFNNQQNWVVEDGYLKCNGTSSWHTVTDKFNDMIKPSTKYLLRIEIVENTLDMILNFDGYGTNILQSSAFLAFAVNEVGVKSHIVTTAPELDSTKNGLFRLPINITNGGTLKIRFMAIEYQEGMENWDIPYFEGIQSVKMPVLTTTGANIFPDDNTMESGAWNSRGEAVTAPSEIRCKNNMIPFPKGLKNGDKMYIVLSDTSINSNTNMHVYDKNKSYLSGNDVGYRTGNFKDGVATVYVDDITKGDYFSFRAISTNTNCKFALMINNPIPYEPFKSNILSCNEEVTLRGIGDIKDTLDGNTGELTQRIGEVVLDGSENWNNYYNGVFITKLSELNSGQANTNWVKISCLSDNTPIRSHQDNKIYGRTHNTNAISTGGDEICVNLRGETTESTTKEYVKTWLSQNPITVQYQLATDSVKTVVLSTLDQDGQPTNLSTFNDITHVSIEAEDLLPTVDLEVPTKIEETLSTLPTLMNDISETQQLLNESIDDQAENINEVSTAITEIRSDIL